LCLLLLLLSMEAAGSIVVQFVDSREKKTYLSKCIQGCCLFFNLVTGRRMKPISSMKTSREVKVSAAAAA
jgi:hypothetical protein